MNTCVDSFERIYIRHFPRLKNLALKLCRNHEDAEDLTQDAFFRAYKAFERYESERPIENWLMRILQNAFFDTKRLQKRRPKAMNESELPGDRGLDDVVDPASAVEEFIQCKAFKERLESAEKNLDEASIRLLHAAYIEETPLSEIGKSLGLRAPTVRSRLHRARAKVRRNEESAAQSAC